MMWALKSCQHRPCPTEYLLDHLWNCNRLDHLGLNRAHAELDF
jgi:hypothetical protein